MEAETETGCEFFRGFDRGRFVGRTEEEGGGGEVERAVRASGGINTTFFFHTNGKPRREPCVCKFGIFNQLPFSYSPAAPAAEVAQTRLALAGETPVGDFKFNIYLH